MIPAIRKMSESFARFPSEAEEILSEIQRLDIRERALREQYRDVIHRLEQVVSERRRLERHLEALEGRHEASPA